MPHYAIGHSSSNWKDPESFRPERFLGDATFADDKMDALQPFSYGPRDCIGRKYVFHGCFLGHVLIADDLALRMPR